MEKNVIVSFLGIQMYLCDVLFSSYFGKCNTAQGRQRDFMENAFKFYMVKKKALPEVLLKVAEVNNLLGAGRVKTIREAIDAVGISRSSYYKYKDDIFPIHEKIQG